MTAGEARTELRQIHMYRNRISERKRRLYQLRSSMENIRISKYGDEPSAGCNPQQQYRLENAIDRAENLEREISNDILSMAEAQQRIVQKIEMLSEPYASVLTKRYIHLHRFEKIAVDMHYSYGRIKHLECIGVRKYCELKVDTM